MNPPQQSRDRWGWGLVALLAVAAVLRLLLVRGGGQMLWSDETRYEMSRLAAGHLAAGDYRAAALALFGGADHLFFKVVGLIPAGLERLAGSTSGQVPGFFFASFSVLNIFLVWRAARLAGAGSREAWAAALLLAAATTHFYYARHLFPYDLALTFGLLALGAAWTDGGGRVRALGCGAWSALAFLSYNGMWLWGAVVLIGHVLAGLPDRRRAVARAGWAGLGLALPILVCIGVARGLGVDLVASFRSFAGSINQGDFGRGWKLLLEYFWAAEGLNFPLGIAALVLVIAGGAAARRWTRGMRWAAGALGILFGLLVLSDVWPVFVIYGRTARCLVPLVCLAGGHALEILWRTGGRVAAAASFVVLVGAAQAVANFWPPLGQVFPRQFYGEAVRVREAVRAQGEPRQLAIIYADMLVGRGSILPALPDHDVLLARPNPMQFRPYLFEGFDEQNRRLLAESDVRMRLIAVNRARFDHPADLRRPYPGVVRLKVQLPERRTPGVPEPLLVTGETGRGDFLYLVYQADNSIRIGRDRWDYGGAVSDPIPVDPTKPVEITLSMGPLHGPLSKEELAAWRVDPHRWLYVEVNGRVVWSHPEEFHPALPASISYLSNYIGGSTAGLKFSGETLGIQSLLVPPFADHPAEVR